MNDKLRYYFPAYEKYKVSNLFLPRKSVKQHFKVVLSFILLCFSFFLPPSLFLFKNTVQTCYKYCGKSISLQIDLIHPS